MNRRSFERPCIWTCNLGFWLWASNFNSRTQTSQDSTRQEAGSVQVQAILLLLYYVLLRPQISASRSFVCIFGIFRVYLNFSYSVYQSQVVSILSASMPEVNCLSWHMRRRILNSWSDLGEEALINWLYLVARLFGSSITHGTHIT